LSQHLEANLNAAAIIIQDTSKIFHVNLLENVFQRRFFGDCNVLTDLLKLRYRVKLYHPDPIVSIQVGNLL